MDSYAAVRALPLRAVLAHFGFEGFKKRPGREEYFGKCPIHNPQLNNTAFSFDDRVYHCFGCEAKGSGSIDLVMDLKKVGFKEAVQILQDNFAAMSVSEVVQSAATNKPFNGNYEKFYVESEWLKARGIRKDILDLYGVGQYFNPGRQSVYSNKVMFPIYRFSNGDKLGYLARTVLPEQADEPKYVFPKNFIKHIELFGAFQLRDALISSGQARLPLGFVLESPLAVMKFREMGFYAVSPWGAYVSPEQVEILAQLFHRVLYLPDRDKSDLQSTGTFHLARHMWVKAPPLPDGVDDPEYLTPEQVEALL